LGTPDRSTRIQQFEARCRQRGLALTVQRRAILEAILDRTDHPTADQVYEDVKPQLPTVSRTTVYRVLETLVELGVITKASSPGAATRFDPMTQRHHHLVCLHCDRLIDLADPQLDQRVALPDVASHSFEIQDFSIHFHGICATCRRKQRAGRSAGAKTPSRTASKPRTRKKAPATKRRTRK
jgi:Fur family peroxide stress response transcriptional regulator